MNWCGLLKLLMIVFVSDGDWLVVLSSLRMCGGGGVSSELV